MLALTDDQLAMVMTAASGLPVEKRGLFFERVAARLTLRGRFTDTVLRRGWRQAQRQSGSKSMPRSTRAMTFKRLNRLACLATTLALAGIASAHADDLSITVALNLGSVIGSEQACGLMYDRDAIERFITEHVKASDMSFPSTLNMMTMGTKSQIESMTESSLKAHCTQIRRIAKEYGFIK